MLIKDIYIYIMQINVATLWNCLESRAHSRYGMVPRSAISQFNAQARPGMRCFLALVCLFLSSEDGKLSPPNSNVAARDRGRPSTARETSRRSWGAELQNSRGPVLLGGLICIGSVSRSNLAEWPASALMMEKSTFSASVESWCSVGVCHYFKRCIGARISAKQISRSKRFSPNSVSTLRGSYGKGKDRCLIEVLTLGRGIFLVNFRIKWLWSHVQVCFDRAGSHKVCRASFASVWGAAFSL